ncbi:xanthine dehydrogenase family protein molybdopterin-binding subunit [Pseudoduganella ginsengisoli]|uniref:Molybdopterin-dependent oxidoreductase n=1 Tax=Pseudoduganella ginsengisoli TaxID=1462440 RepID=A0A6L6Q1E6_9BURK|nr:molybdopterin cofactor-binding domain-containing protein [Pseudoduganella ginsengisoli]MTW03450.1 molybdopterin-dependent oxidoreductase [Pseudoduganella ginsengisoli]
MKRRTFILSGLAAAGAVLVGWGALPPGQRIRGKAALPVSQGAVALNGWVAVAPDNTVTVAMARSEMGQGVLTALPMLVAEELDVPLAQVKLVQAPADKIYGNVALIADGLPFHPDDESRTRHGAEWIIAKVARELGINITGGSSSIKDLWLPMREAGATARALLIEAAARNWRVPAAECRTEDGHVLHGSGKKAAYGELAQAAAGMTPPANVRIKTPGQFRLIGASAPRRDTPAKSNGSAVFGIDARPQGMLYAAVRMAPVFGGTVASSNTQAVLNMPGVKRVVDYSAALEGQTGARAGLAVVAQHYWQARQAADALDIKWNDGPHASLSSDAIFRELGKRLDDGGGHTFHEAGDIGKLDGAARIVRAEYRAPYLAHATMEPMNCTAQVADGKVRLWVSTQSPAFAIDMAARAAGVKPEQVELDIKLLGGGFGRRLDVDFIVQAVAIAKQCGGLPVQVIWSREDDMRHDVYRPAALARFAAGLDAAGNLLAWDNQSAGAAIGHQFLKRNMGMPGAGPDKNSAEGEYDMPYEVPNQRIRHVNVESVAPVGYWRSVGHSHNAFFKESFIDEMAHAAGLDPVVFRRGLLQRHPRHLAVLNAAVDKAGAPPEGRAHGVALHQAFGSIVAQVAEVSVAGKEIVVHRVVCAVDCGIAVNPGIIAQQVESSVVFGLSAALMGEITIDGGKVVQGNFSDYPVLRMNQAPKVDTVIMLSAEPPQGMGEPAVPPVAPAVANAVFKLTGQRLRSLPLKLVS